MADNSPSTIIKQNNKQHVYKEKLDTDLPNFQPTKYNSVSWRFTHWIFNFIFSGCFLCFPIFCRFCRDSKIAFKYLYLLGSASQMISAFVEWTHYVRGCLLPSNLNSICKTNIDNSCEAKYLRAKPGITYFISFVASVILTVGSALTFICECDFTEHKKYLFTAMIIFTFITVAKLDKIVSPTKQYFFLNDISNAISHFLFLLGSLCYSLGSIVCFLPLFDFVDFYEKTKLHLFLFMGGGVLFVFSSILLLYRYFFSGLQDLNAEILSEYSI